MLNEIVENEIRAVENSDMSDRLTLDSVNELIAKLGGRVHVDSSANHVKLQYYILLLSIRTLTEN